MGSVETRVILDTDIGTDVDDILALVALAKSARHQLLGVTTVHGDVVRRARVAQFVCNELERSDVSVVPGEQGTMVDRGELRGWKGHEGVGIPNLDEIHVDTDVDGVTFLCSQAQQHQGEIEIFAIGPLTNIARAIQRDPSFVENIRHLYIMGGAFWMDRAEHNILCDPEAAAEVFNSRIPMTVCGLDVTTRVWLREDDVVTVREQLGSLGHVLDQQIRHWWTFLESVGAPDDGTGKVSANNPHDPLALLPAMSPHLFSFQRGFVEIDLSGDTLGYSRLRPDEQGNVLVASDVRVGDAEREILQRITS